MRGIMSSLFAGLLLAACTVEPQQTALCFHSGPEPVVRPDQPPPIVWPADSGFAPPGELPVTVQPGALLDRFGDNAGKFFSPKGTGYRERSLPYVCQGYAYAVYRVVQPLPASIGTAAPWFGEPGGALQIQTTECVNQLLAAGVLQAITDPPSPPPCS
jgi:hypothetical protein